MEIEIREQSADSLARWADISISFEVTRILEVTPQKGGLGGFALAEVPVGALGAPRGRQRTADAVMSLRRPDRAPKRARAAAWRNDGTPGDRG